MPPRIALVLTLLALAGASLCGCRAPQSTGAGIGVSTGSQSSPAAPPEIPERDKAEACAAYSSGVLHDLNGETSAAMEDYRRAALHDPASTDLVLEVTQRMISVGQYDAAREILAAATARPGAPWDLYARLGYVCTKLNRTDEAIRANRAAIHGNPRALVGYQNLVLNYLHADKPQSGWSVLQDAAAVKDVSPEFLVGLAELFTSYGMQEPASRKQANEQAGAVLRRAAQLDIPDPELRLKLADGFNLLGQDAEAIDVYAGLLKMLPAGSTQALGVRVKLSNCYLRIQQPEKAMEQLQAVIRENPTDIQAYYRLGSIAFDQKQYASAVEYFSKGLLLDPEFERGYAFLAEAQLHASQAAEAQQTLEKGLGKFPESFELEYLAAVTGTEQKDFTNAVNHFTRAEIIGRAAATNRLDAFFYFQFGAACERKGDLKQAEQYLERSLQLKPEFSDAQNYLGYMWAERGENLERARDLIEKALKAEPRNSAFLDSMGWVLFRLHQPEQALNYLLQAQALSGEPDATVCDHLGDVYAALGRQEEARAAWTKSVSLEKNDRVQQKLGPAAP
ncbi:MAG: tetratricopeptide repeat protein [Verrucomicrobiota bacterium]